MSNKVYTKNSGDDSDDLKGVPPLSAAEAEYLKHSVYIPSSLYEMKSYQRGCTKVEDK